MLTTLALTAALLMPVGHHTPDGGNGNGDDTCGKSCGWFSPSFENSPVNLVLCTVPQACTIGPKQ